MIISGAIGVHGIAVMSVREGLEFGAEVQSDCAPLNGLVAAMIASGRDIHVLRDPTRGGVATALNEIAQASGVGVGAAGRGSVRGEVRPVATGGRLAGASCRPRIGATTTPPLTRGPGSLPLPAPTLSSMAVLHTSRGNRSREAAASAADPRRHSSARCRERQVGSDVPS